MTHHEKCCCFQCESRAEVRERILKLKLREMIANGTLTGIERETYNVGGERE